MNESIRVGIIGANPDKGWGSSVHVPAIDHVDGLTLTAVGTTRAASADQSARKFGAAHAFSDPQALVTCSEVDLVVVAVKAPEHHRLAMMALEAGKHVYCEWPLAATTAQADEMTALAHARGVRAMVGLQARGAPALLHARDLIRDGYVGRPFAVRMNCALPGGGARRSEEGLYVIEKANGASTLAIQGGHAIDALRFCVGELANLTSVVANQFPEVEVIETGEHRVKDAPDQVLVCGTLENGASVSIALNGGVMAGHGIALDIFGDKGTLSVSWPGGLNFQMSELELRGAQAPQRQLQPLPVPPTLELVAIPAGLEGRPPYPGVPLPRATIVNVANLYVELVQAIRNDRAPTPSFDTGLSLHHLLDDIEEGGRRGSQD